MANSTVKVTKVDMFNAIKALPDVAGNEDFVAFIDHEIELIQKKNANRKPSKTQEQNAHLFEVVAGLLTEEGQTVSEIKAQSTELAGLSTQKVSALLKIMQENGTAVKVVDKKKALFFAPTTEEVE